MDDFIELRGISKTYPGQGMPAVDNANLTLKRGEVFSLLGPSGCGKTTLLRILGGFEIPDAGQILINGKDVTDLPPNKRSINTVFQNYALFPHLSIWDNVAFGPKMAKKPKKFIEDEVERMLDLVDLLDQADKKPHQISGGQKQRVAIARAFVRNAPILVLDEATASLDSKAEAEVQAAIDRLAEHRTVICVAHRLSTLAAMDRVIVLTEGQIVEAGGFEALLRKGGAFAAMAAKQGIFPPQ